MYNLARCYYLWLVYIIIAQDKANKDGRNEQYSYQRFINRRL